MDWIGLLYCTALHKIANENKMNIMKRLLRRQKDILFQTIRFKAKIVNKFCLHSSILFFNLIYFNPGSHVTSCHVTDISMSHHPTLCPCLCPCLALCLDLHELGSDLTLFLSLSLRH